jgi:hypothetical protein
MTNRKRLRQIEQNPRRTGKPQRFALGSRVVDDEGRTGRIDAVYLDLAAAEDAMVIPSAEKWYRELAQRPKTSPDGHWYSILIEDEGAVLIGETDLENA